MTELTNSVEIDAKKDGKHLEKIMITSNEWDFLQELTLVLGPFEEATKYLGGEKYVTHSIMHPIIKEIKRLLSTSTTSTLSSNTYSEIENVDNVFVAINEVETLENEENNNQKRKSKLIWTNHFETKDMLDKVKKCLHDAICFYWKFLPEDFLISTILDPRVKYMDNEIEEEEILRKKYEEYQENYIQSPIESWATSPIPSGTSTFSTVIYKPKLFTIFKQNQIQASDEVVEYLREDKAPFEQDPFDWWIRKKNKYPVLAKMARIYLAAPATSTLLERLFSDAGNLLSAKRNRLDPELFKYMIFLKRNASKVDSIHSVN